MKHIFVSYSRNDSDCAARIVRQLEAQGIEVWFDTQSIPGGSQWAIEIQKGIQNAFAVLVLWSSSAMTSDYVRQEYEFALQQKVQHPQNALSVIPIMLESFIQAPLPALLSGFNVIQLTDCHDYQSLKSLIRYIKSLSNAEGRTIFPLNKSLPLDQQANSKSISGQTLVSVPFMQSVHTRANIIAPPNTDLSSLPPFLQLCLEFKGKENDYQFIDQIFNTIKGQSQPFFALHITSNPHAGQYDLDNTRQGAWLDAVNTSYEAAENLVGRGGATVHVFSLAPAVLTFAIGKLFYEYWHLQLYNFAKPGYRLVLDTRDL